MRRFALAACAAAVAMAYLEVASLPPTGHRQTSYTWDSILAEVRGDIRATVDGLRREREERKAILEQMRHDMRALNETLSVQSPNRLG
ncbi:MAG: hypothetical protein ABIR34_01785 [Marmoricola sp.]